MIRQICDRYVERSPVAGEVRTSGRPIVSSPPCSKSSVLTGIHALVVVHRDHGANRVNGLDEQSIRRIGRCSGFPCS